MKYVVKVTATDIRHGMPGDPRACPVFRAARRCLKKAGVVECVANHWIDFCGIDTESVNLPEKATKFIKSYDRIEPVKPFTFCIFR